MALFGGNTHFGRRGASVIAALITGVLITIAVAGMAFAYYYLFLRKAAPSATVSADAPANVYVGQPFDVTVSAVNNAPDPLANVVLSTVLPEGLSFTESGGERFKDETIGDMEPGAMVSRTVRLVATGSANSIKRLDVKLRYTPKIQPDQEFSAKGFTDVVVKPVAELNLEVPQQVLPGQKFDIAIHYRNLSDKPVSNAHLKLTVPSLMRIDSATSTPEAGREGLVWNFGDLAGNATGTIVLEATVLRGQSKSFFQVGAVIQSDVEGGSYDLVNQSANIGISEAPLSLSLKINNDPDHTAKLDEYLNYVLHYKNNADVAFRDVAITAALSGRLFDYPTLQTDGVFNSVNNTIGWGPGTNKELSTIEAGGEGDVRFSIHVKSAFPMKSVSDKNFTLKLDTNISSPTVAPGVEAENTTSMNSFETKVGGGADFSAFALHTDTGVVNTGPYPPQANKITQFTIHWKIKNAATDLTGVHIEATLQSGARFLKVVRATTESKPVADQNGIVTWDIPRIPATQGYVGDPVEAVFQVEVQPGVNKAGQELLLMGKSIMTAKDDFTGQDMRFDARELNAGAKVLP